MNGRFTFWAEKSRDGIENFFKTYLRRFKKNISMLTIVMKR